MISSIRQIFDNQRPISITLRQSDASQRKAKLRKLKQAILANEDAVFAALEKDLGKARFEAAFTEVYFVYGEIDFAIKHLTAWMRPRKVAPTLTAIFAKNRIYYEPKGVSLIIAPWNYPFQLLMSPLVSAIAAGNCCIVKPSEISPATSAVIKKIISDHFDEQEIACVEGDARVAAELLEIPFDHIFFTGGTEIGKKVMAAAAKNLTSVTLELGGKSPVIIDEHTDLKKTAEKIMWGKFINAGQTCIAPDYVLIKPQQEDQFVKYASLALGRMYFYSGQLNEGSYGKIINSKNFERLQALIAEAENEGAIIKFGGKANRDKRVIEPIILSNVNPSSKLMQEEIFGPVLPLISYSHLPEAIDFINQRPKPLALYVFSDDSNTVNQIIKQTSAGGTAVNDVIVHIANPNMPFGGAGNSGMGSSHGFFGFKAFSHQRAVMFQSALDFNRFAYPPYGEKSSLLKWLKKLM